MTQISRDFAPPFNLIAPYFVIGMLFFLSSFIALLFLDVKLSIFDFRLIGWVHLYLLGFVMMIIFGAMAQLVPVVIETGHRFVDFFYLIYPLLGIGLILMLMGFFIAPVWLIFGGGLVLVSMLIFSIDLFATLKKSRHSSVAVQSIKMSNLFLLLGIASGFAMALSFSGIIPLDVRPFLTVHIFSIFGGYVLLTIMGISMVLLPMFGLAHGFSQKPIQIAFKLLNLSVFFALLSTLLPFSWILYLAFIFIVLAILFYFWQILLMQKVRARKERDIWSRSLTLSFGSLILALLGLIVWLFTQNEALLKSSMWLLLVGFVGFMITAHLYKIVPFLVWFERFSPLVGKKKVPMLHEMVPVHLANAQFRFSSLGLFMVALALLTNTPLLLSYGAYVLSVGALFLLFAIIKIIRYTA